MCCAKPVTPIKLKLTCGPILVKFDSVGISTRAPASPVQDARRPEKVEARRMGRVEGGREGTAGMAG